MASEPYEGEVEELRQRLKDAEETLRAIRAGEVDALVVAGDGVDRVFTLQGADHPYRALIEAMQQGAVTLGVDGTILYCNLRFAEMVGWPHERVIGVSLTEFLPAPKRAAFMALLDRGRTLSAEGEFTLLTGGGDPTPAYLALAPLELGGAEAVCMVVTDLTEPKKHHDLQEVNRRKDEFLAMLAHELRNPLAPIRNALHLQKQSVVADGHSGEVHAMMERQVDHLARLIDDLMDVSRIATGNVELRLVDVDLAAVLGRAVETVRPQIDERGHILSVRVTAEPIRLRADPTRLEQVFDNLLTNAAKYSNPGARIDLSTRRDGDSAVVSLRDNGIGIDPAKLPHIFDLFVQAERRLDRSQGGLGIGLSLVRSLIEMHGGVVTAASAGLGHGTEFVVRLPAQPRVAAPVPVARPRGWSPAEVPLPRHRILVVDDNYDSANSMAMLLKRMWKQDVEVAHDGEAALVKAASYRPQIILLDIGLPGLSGYDVAERLRAQAVGRCPTLVAMTGWGQEEDLRRSRDAGFAHHLVKPVDLDVLRAVIAGNPLREDAEGEEHPLVDVDARWEG